jgi:hypothetical protein
MKTIIAEPILRHLRSMLANMQDYWLSNLIVNWLSSTCFRPLCFIPTPDFTAFPTAR